MTPVAAVDIGTNSTRLLIADGTQEVVRESVVTRLGDGVDRTGRLADDAQTRVLDVLARFREQIGNARGAAVMTSAVRDAANGAEFARRVEDALGFPARTLSGDEEARLTFAGATSLRRGAELVLVIDVGGGSTELVLGRAGAVGWHASLQVGVVRHSERHLHSDPPTAAELDALRADVRAAAPRERSGDEPRAQRSQGLRPRQERGSAAVDVAIAVAGTPTQAAAIDLGLDHYDPALIEGHVLTAATLAEQLDRLASLPLAERRKIRGLDPARAPVIVAGIAILLEVVRCFGLTGVEASERDILWGLALLITTEE